MFYRGEHAGTVQEHRGNVRGTQKTVGERAGTSFLATFGTQSLPRVARIRPAKGSIASNKPSIASEKPRIASNKPESRHIFGESRQIKVRDFAPWTTRFRALSAQLGNSRPPPLPRSSAVPAGVHTQSRAIPRVLPRDALGGSRRAPEGHTSAVPCRDHARSPTVPHVLPWTTRRRSPEPSISPPNGGASRVRAGVRCRVHEQSCTDHIRAPSERTTAFSGTSRRAPIRLTNANLLRSPGSTALIHPWSTCLLAM